MDSFKESEEPLFFYFTSVVKKQILSRTYPMKLFSKKNVWYGLKNGEAEAS
jgi:hypothetical protein